MALRCIISNDAATPLPATSPTAKKRDWVPASGIAEQAHLAVVSSNRTYGLVAILRLPSFEGEISRRQELELNLSCQIEVLLMVRPFLLIEVIETVAAERIELEPVFFDRVAAGLAETIASDVDLCESCIYFCEELVEIVIGD